MPRIDSLSELTNASDDFKRINNLLTQEAKKPLKYHNKPVDGFASGREANRANQLQLMEQAKEIFCLCYQVRLPLADKITYIADFVYLDKELRVHVEDVKGIRTPVYKIKKKLFRERYILDITEVPL